MGLNEQKLYKDCHEKVFTCTFGHVKWNHFQLDNVNSSYSNEGYYIGQNNQMGWNEIYIIIAIKQQKITLE